MRLQSGSEWSDFFKTADYWHYFSIVLSYRISLLNFDSQKMFSSTLIQRQCLTAGTLQLRKTLIFCFSIISVILFSLLTGCGGGNDEGPPRTADQPFTDPVQYGMRPDDSVADTNEGAAVTHHQMMLNGQSIRYRATAGHLVTVDPGSSNPNAKVFYVAYTAENEAHKERPVTFLYNGGPGSAAVWLLLGSFSPKRIKTSMPSYTPPPPYTVEDNPESLLDKTDLVFINPIGTGYSAAIAPNKNKDFWGVDQDAQSLAQFIKRYLTINDRWNSPKFLMGESYGTARSAVLSYALNQAGVELNGVALVSSILDYSKREHPAGLFPTYAANAWYHKRTRVNPVPQSLAEYMDEVSRFARSEYGPAISEHRRLRDQLNTLVFDHPNPAVKARLDEILKTAQTYQAVIDALRQGAPAEIETAEQLVKLFADFDQLPELSDVLVKRAGDYIGIDSALIRREQAIGMEQFLNTLLADQGKKLGAYDGRVLGINTGIAKDILPNSGGNDPSIVAVNGAYTAAWNFYLKQALKYTTRSAFISLNDQIFKNWDYKHTDPTGAEKGGMNGLYTAGDLAATMSLNPDLKVLQMSGYYDAVTPFYQAVLDLEEMPIAASLRKNIDIKNYPSGHMIYLDGESRIAMKADLVKFYERATRDSQATQRILRRQQVTLRKLRIAPDAQQ